MHSGKFINFVHSVKRADDECARRVIFYPTATMMTLFFHIFAKPSSPQAKADLELMSSTEKLIRNMPLPELTLRQTSHVQLLTKFVSDLVRLGDLAMLKARV